MSLNRAGDASNLVGCCLKDLMFLNKVHASYTFVGSLRDMVSGRDLVVPMVAEAFPKKAPWPTTCKAHCRAGSRRRGSHTHTLPEPTWNLIRSALKRTVVYR